MVNPARLRARLPAAFVLLVSAHVALVTGCSRDGDGRRAAVPEAVAPAPAKTPAKAEVPAGDAGAPAEVQRMLGRWLRSDGTYVLELRGADRSGIVQAAYFNPKSINVSRSIWLRGADGVQVVVELNDTGYPGATYVLGLAADGDRLVGKYNQPQMGQSFDVEFIRQKKFP
ncbi:MAG: hypothetical protein ACO3G4_04215 [Opitutaceae bacterium]